MNRLIAGDVGSGKTVIAGLAALTTARAGAQSALVAPTEILASQHAETLSRLFGESGLRVALLTGSLEARERAMVLRSMRAGGGDCLVGTHALFHADLRFPNLALIVVDEQHRFGVEQRAELTRLGAGGKTPHFLSLTATPIPRTLQLTAYGDVDVTLLTPRPGQQPVRTEIVAPDMRNTVYAALANHMRAGEQVFVICPRVEEGEEEMRSVVTEFERLRTEVFPRFRVGMLHGKMSSQEKQETLGKFRRREIDVLVASSVVEVGVDIPNAAALLIEGAERFGLAQLHQFRGRVGRRGQVAVCYLASTSGVPEALDRLRVLERSTNGLEIAEEDLTRRGAGEIYGTRQSGGARLRVATITDVSFLLNVRRAAETLLERDPRLTAAPLLARRIAQLNVTTHFE
jgi:ATP-dependent DNA helicase RecG